MIVKAWYLSGSILYIYKLFVCVWYHSNHADFYFWNIDQCYALKVIHVWVIVLRPCNCILSKTTILHTLKEGKLPFRYSLLGSITQQQHERALRIRWSLNFDPIVSWFLNLLFFSRPIWIPFDCPDQTKAMIEWLQLCGASVWVCGWTGEWNAFWMGLISDCYCVNGAQLNKRLTFSGYPRGKFFNHARAHGWWLRSRKILSRSKHDRAVHSICCCRWNASHSKLLLIK